MSVNSFEGNIVAKHVNAKIMTIMAMGVLFTLNSKKHFWTRDTSKPWASAGV